MGVISGPLFFQNLTLFESTHNEVHKFMLRLLCLHRVSLKLVINYKLTGICNIPEILFISMVIGVTSEHPGCKISDYCNYHQYNDLISVFLVFYLITKWWEWFFFFSLHKWEWKMKVKYSFIFIGNENIFIFKLYFINYFHIILTTICHYWGTICVTSLQSPPPS